MSHVKILASGAGRVESDAAHFLKRASEERTSALHARHSDARQKHLDNAQRFEDRVRAIVVRRQLLTVPSPIQPFRASAPSGEIDR